ncbi:MAG TPA: Gfo/Idh/MocA family oxidoreductase [Ignavibacteria bacterium]|nr:Gfo/Idh/MocA family oxidoreductase [Ignavibacteria bacterium]HRF66729.1 Gfo/Idh/MocA family oxidoreductase [Ignavibacteria bacterium]HRJ04073.1 Gfo/Idh/MocA family oxidoreductase [Ignavibacteria bacterium]HRJ85625.1 Gfo/Idh/MocA family oxidoreductase [Ignavibacteria bacterium]
MADKNLNIGLAGCGHLGKIHTRLISEIAKTDPRIKFKGIFDPDTETAAAVSGEYKVKAYNSIDELLRETDTLIIVTPTSTHFEIASKALNKDINVFIEKPVTGSLSEAEALIKQAEGKPVKIQVGHVERFNPALVALERFEMKPMFIESHRLAQFNPRGTDVSVIQDLMIHDIDIILHLAKSKVKKIDANGVAVISDEIDIANARLTLESGCVANLTSSRISLKKMRKMRIFQNNAYISVDFLNNKSEVFRLTDKETEATGMTFDLNDTKKIVYDEPKPENPENINPIKNELESFFESVLTNKPVKVTLTAGKEAVEVADKIIQIIKNGNQGN